MDMTNADATSRNAATDHEPAYAYPSAASVNFGFENTYARLPERLYSRLAPTPVASPRLIKVNSELAETLGIDSRALVSKRGVEILAGNKIADGSSPIAMAYAGHQFGYFVPQLGDGRAILLGEVLGKDGVRYDIQLKGSGPTPFSRRGDGRAALGPVLREYIVSEAMAALGVPTTRALAAVTTGESVLRETVLPGAIFTRVAASHLRVGTFQYFAARNDTDGLRTLADYAIARHYSDATNAASPIRVFLDGVVARQAGLIAQWMAIGFVHGVMNTDNSSISGETIDYGPCAFMEAYDPATVFSSIDAKGRYAYGNQPRIALWNLTRLAETLLPLLAEVTGSQESAAASANESLAAFEPRFMEARLVAMRRKIGLFIERPEDAELIDDLLERMRAGGADFTLTFRRLCDAAESVEGDAPLRTLFSDPPSFDEWASKWRRRSELEPISSRDRAAAMRMANPAFIPRNHMVEAVLNAATWQQDFHPFEELLNVLSRPYDDQPGMERYTFPARPEERVCQTFCGT